MQQDSSPNSRPFILAATHSSVTASRLFVLRDEQGCNRVQAVTLTDLVGVPLICSEMTLTVNIADNPVVNTGVGSAQ